MKKIIYILLGFILLSILLSGCKVPQKSTQEKFNVEEKTVFRYDTVTVKHTKRVPEIVKVTKYQDSIVCNHTKDTIIITKTVYKAKKIKIKDSYNVDNSEVIKLKNSNLIKDSQIDSLQKLLAGKDVVGEQTNNGDKWWKWLLIGIVIGAGGLQLVRTLITKKV